MHRKGIASVDVEGRKTVWESGLKFVNISHRVKSMITLITSSKVIFKSTLALQ